MTTPTPTLESLAASLVAPGPSRAMAGVILLAANRTGKIYNRTFGQLSLSPTSPEVTENAVLWLASCTKLVTSIACLQCIERGLLDLDADVAETLTDLKGIGVLKGFDDKGMPVTEPARGKVTLRMLLTHTSGFGYAFIMPDVYRAHKAMGLRPENEAGDSLRMSTGPLLFHPGTGWMYGTSLEAAGRLVEAVTHTTLGAYMQTHIFTPLNLTSFFWRVKDRPDLKSKFLQTVELTSTGLIPSRATYPYNPPTDCGGGGLFGTAPEYLTLLHSLLVSSPKIFKHEKTFSLLFTTQVRGPQEPFFLDEMGSLYSEFLPEHAPELKWGQSLGGAVCETDVPGWIREGTMQWSGMPGCHWFVDRRSGLVTFLATQVNPTNTPGVEELRAKFHAEMVRRFGGDGSGGSKL